MRRQDGKMKTRSQHTLNDTNTTRFALICTSICSTKNENDKRRKIEATATATSPSETRLPPKFKAFSYINSRYIAIYSSYFVHIPGTPTSYNTFIFHTTCTALNYWFNSIYCVQGGGNGDDDGILLRISMDYEQRTSAKYFHTNHSLYSCIMYYRYH